MSSKKILALGGCLLLGFAGVTRAEPTVAELQTQLQRVQQQLADVQAAQNNTALNERRVEETKALIREVLADADTRASLLESSLTAGRKNDRFFLASDDGDFLLNIGGTIQVQYIADFRQGKHIKDVPIQPDQPNVTNDFRIRRARLEMDGNIGGKSIIYSLYLNTDRDSGAVYAEVATVGIKVTDALTVSAGRAKDPFLREEIISDRYQLATERSFVNGLFTTGYVEGLFVTWDVLPQLRLYGSLTDGSQSGEYAGGASKDFNTNNADLAVTGRAEFLVNGTWDQAKQFAAWSDEPTWLLLLGGGMHYEVGKTDTIADNNKTLTWTVDAQGKINGLNLFGAFTGQQFDNGVATGVAETNNDAYGLVLQGGYMVIKDKLEPFARWEYVQVRNTGAGADMTNNIFTVGANYYLKKQMAKLTLDVVWVIDPLSGAFTEQGLLSDGISGRDNQITARAQFQVLF